MNFSKGLNDNLQIFNTFCGNTVVENSHQCLTNCSLDSFVSVYSLTMGPIVYGLFDFTQFSLQFYWQTVSEELWQGHKNEQIHAKQGGGAILS